MKEKVKAELKRNEDVQRGYLALKLLEEQQGHVGVLAAIKLWMNAPLRGSFK